MTTAIGYIHIGYCGFRNNDDGYRSNGLTGTEVNVMPVSKENLTTVSELKGTIRYAPGQNTSN